MKSSTRRHVGLLPALVDADYAAGFLTDHLFPALFSLFPSSGLDFVKGKDTEGNNNFQAECKVLAEVFIRLLELPNKKGDSEEENGPLPPPPSPLDLFLGDQDGKGFVPSLIERLFSVGHFLNEKLTPNYLFCDYFYSHAIYYLLY